MFSSVVRYNSQSNCYRINIHIAFCFNQNKATSAIFIFGLFHTQPIVLSKRRESALIEPRFFPKSTVFQPFVFTQQKRKKHWLAEPIFCSSNIFVCLKKGGVNWITETRCIFNCQWVLFTQQNYPSSGISITKLCLIVDKLVGTRRKLVKQCWWYCVWRNWYPFHLVGNIFINKYSLDINSDRIIEFGLGARESSNSVGSFLVQFHWIEIIFNDQKYRRRK